MKNIYKNCIIAILTFIFSFEIFAAVVSNSDGVAFISKSEFENMKKDFDTQVNDYNNSIDGKIDGAIAKYLAGVRIGQRAELKSYLNEINQKFVDSKTLDWPISKLGTYRKHFMSLAFMECAVGTANSASELRYVTGDINNPSWVEANINDYGIYYYGTKNTDGSYTMNNYINARPYGFLIGVHTSGAGQFSPSTTGRTIPVKTYTNADNNSFQTSADTWTFTLGGINKTLNIVKNFGITNEFKNPYLDFVTGNKLIRDEDNDGEDDDIYFLDANDLNKPGETDTDLGADYEGHAVYRNSGGQIQAWTSSASSKNTKLRIYRHVYTKTKREKILNNKATQKYGENIYYYEGLPIFKNEEGDGDVELVLKFSNTNKKGTVFEIQNKRFKNVALPITGYKTEYKLGNLMYATESEIKMTIETKKDETYWIKARPIATQSTASPTTITTKKISLITEG